MVETLEDRLLLSAPTAYDDWQTTPHDQDLAGIVFAYVSTAYESAAGKDNDPNTETAAMGTASADREAAVVYRETLRDVSKPLLHLTHPMLGDFSTGKLYSNTTVHEVAHQFGVSHFDGSPNIMSTAMPATSIWEHSNDLKFIAKHIRAFRNVLRPGGSSGAALNSALEAGSANGPALPVPNNEDVRRRAQSRDGVSLQFADGDATPFGAVKSSLPDARFEYLEHSTDSLERTAAVGFIQPKFESHVEQAEPIESGSPIKRQTASTDRDSELSEIPPPVRTHDSLDAALVKLFSEGEFLNEL